MTIVSVNGRGYTAELLKEAIAANRDGKHPIQLIMKSGDYYRTETIDYRAGLRYPHLARVAGTPDRLSAIFAASLGEQLGRESQQFLVLAAVVSERATSIGLLANGLDKAKE